MKDAMTEGGREIWLLVGLGNPGPQYAQTWHNCGYMVLEILAQKLGVSINQARFKGALGQADYMGRRLLLLKPETYMNNSGEAVRAALDYYRIPHRRLIVCYDDIDLPLGCSRLREQGGPGTHNGMRSIVRHIGADDFLRIRVGIGPLPETIPLMEYVLRSVDEESQKLLYTALERLAAGCLLCTDEARRDQAMRFLNVGAKSGQLSDAEATAVAETEAEVFDGVRKRGARKRRRL